jgi:uncharacterized protein YbjT (DUF2867 family)
MEDGFAMTQAMKRVDAVFLITTPFESGVECESRQGFSVVDCAAKVGIRHLVYSSLPAASGATGVPFFDSKAVIERYIKSLGLPHTIVAPSFFMENLSGPFHIPGLLEGRLTIPLSPACKLQMISLADVVTFVSLVLEQRYPFMGQRIELASDELTPMEIARVLSRALCRNIRYYRTPIQEVKAWSKDLSIVYEWLDRVGTGINLPSFRFKYNQLDWLTLEQWAETQSWGMLTWERVPSFA